MNKAIQFSRPPDRQKTGFTLLEVMLAMVILAFGILGVLATFQWADEGLHLGANGMRAQAMVESRLEAKRTSTWEGLLADDIDGDGLPEVLMYDDGRNGDVQAGDGVYTGSVEREGIRLVWTVQTERPGPIANAGSVVILAKASYPAGRGRPREISMGMLRANPRYIGERD